MALGRHSKRIFTLKRTYVSTTDFCPNAKQFAKLYQLDLVSYEGFLDWIIEHGLMLNPLHYSVFRMINLAQRGRFYLSKCLTLYLRIPDDRFITVVRVFNTIELWNPSVWEDYREDKKVIFDEIGQRMLDIEI